MCYILVAITTVASPLNLFDINNLHNWLEIAALGDHIGNAIGGQRHDCGI
jgi:hypothetical protein